jgi:phosphatidylglycerol phospholipase C
MFQKTMVGPFGNSFLKDAKKANRSTFLWTVNDEVWMKWSICKGVDGVITDDPKKYLEVSEQTHKDRKLHLPLSEWGSLICINVLAAYYSLLFRYIYGFRIDVGKLRKNL